jgi:Effector-associated domain 1/Ubiquitin-conjugating enzyme
MSGTETRGSDGGQEEPDLPLGEGDIDRLMDELSRIFTTEARATAFLRSVRFPGRLIPGWTDAYDFWSRIFEDLSRGAMQAPYRRLIAAALRVYGGNMVLEDLQRGHQVPDAPDAPHAPDQSQETPADPPPAPPETCHIVIRVNSDEERADSATWLARQNLEPVQEWSSLTAVSFRLSQTDPDVVAATMRARPDIGWTVVPPGQPDYLLRQIFAEGPDGRSFRLNDVPASSTVGSVAAEIIEHYPEVPGRDAPTVVDLVGSDGSGQRANPDNTLHEEGVTEGSRLRVGMQRRAAAVNPLDRRDALFGVRNQMQQYVDANPGFKVWPNSPALPTEYDIEFAQASFGPPAMAGDQPPDIDVHELRIVLGPDFPITAPRVLWLTEIFHPNVYPTYEGALLRERPYMRGLVCLGTLAESYQPSLHFGDLCATLKDIAGYRNYSVFVPSDDAADPATGQPMLRGDYYDRNAAEWAIGDEGQERIRKIGGAPVLRVLSAKPTRYGFEIEPDA